MRWYYWWSANVNAIIVNAKNTGTITGAQAGGIAGSWSGGAQVDKTENFGNVIGTGRRNSKAGGIMGSVATPMTISNSGNSGSVASSGLGTPLAGGIIASSTGIPITISNSYNYASLTATTTGGMVGQVSTGCTITTSYYLDTTTSAVGDGSATGGASLNSTEFVDQASFVGWDFSAIWQMGASYPTLK